MYHLQHHAYCGMSGIRHTFDDRADARTEVARTLRNYRRRYAVTTLTRGKRWEILEPDDCAMVPDACGTLALTRQTFECCACGTRYETRDDARQCCRTD